MLSSFKGIDFGSWRTTEVSPQHWLAVRLSSMLCAGHPDSFTSDPIKANGICNLRSSHVARLARYVSLCRETTLL